ncbi:MAG: hypothetical protein QW272_05140 [Candidatus Methanomethylicaceae archaeon]
MKEKITLISTIILAILLLASLYYGFFIKPKEITYTSFIPTTFSTTKSITKTEKETTTYSTTKTETLTTTYRIIKEEALIEIHKDAIHGWEIRYITPEKKIEIQYVILEFIVVNTGEHTILIDKDFIILKGERITEEKELSLPFYEGKWNITKAILTPSNRTAFFKIEAKLDTSNLTEDYVGIGEIFITYKIIETNQFITFNSTFTYTISKPRD